MVEAVADRAAGAAWKIQNLQDHEERLERAAGRVEGLIEEHETAAMVIYEAALMKSGRSREEIRGLVHSFRENFEEEGEESLTIPRVSGIMNSQGEEWFFGDEDLRRLTGRLLGQFQHRVAQYNYVDEREVLRRWAESHDTRLFIRRRIHDTEPVVGVVSGFELYLMQHLRFLAGGNTIVPSDRVRDALGSLDLIDPERADDYDVIGQAELLALYLEIPAPVVGEMLEDLSREGVREFPEPPQPEPSEEEGEEPAAGGEEVGDDVPEKEAAGEKPTRVQDPHEKGDPEPGEERPASPEHGREGSPGKAGEEE
jgi:hypothetical protein